MIVIRTAEELACMLASSLDKVVKERLAVYRDHLSDYAEFDFEELGRFIIVQPDDKLKQLNGALGPALKAGELFAAEPEAVMRHGDWLEVLFVISDDGFGVVLFIPLMEKIDSSFTLVRQHLASSLDLDDQPKARTS